MMLQASTKVSLKRHAFVPMMQHSLQEKRALLKLNKELKVIMIQVSNLPAKRAERQHRFIESRTGLL